MGLQVGQCVSIISESRRFQLANSLSCDGFKLVHQIRVTVDGVTESPLDLLSRRKRLLKPEKPEDWNDYKAALLQLIRDWEKAIDDGIVDDGIVDKYGRFTLFQ